MRWTDVLNGVYQNPTNQGLYEAYHKLRPSLGIVVRDYAFADTIYRVDDSGNAQPIQPEDLSLTEEELKMVLNIIVGWCLAYQQIADLATSRIVFQTEANDGNEDTN